MIDSTAPDLYPVNDDELCEEMKRITVASSMAWPGPITIITGTRDFGSAFASPVIVLKNDSEDRVHLLALLSASIE